MGATLAVLGLTAAAKPNAPVLALLRSEGIRLAAVIHSLDRGEKGDTPPIAADRYANDDPCEGGGVRKVVVTNTRELAAALADAKPGDHIRMKDGVYRGSFVLARSGTPDAPIVLCGSRAAILDGGGVQNGYALHLRDANHCRLLGFTVRNSRKGIMTDGSSHNLLRGVEVHHIGDEGVHFRRFSHHNLIQDSWIHDVGLDTPFFGEAIYIGSARSNWGNYTGGRPDASDSNRVIGNVLGPDVRAEGVDAKEGTRGGVISGNIFLGRGATAADSWIDLKCSNYRVEGNTGTYDPRQPWRGPVMVYPSAGGWGQGNVVGEHHAVPVGKQDSGIPYRFLRKGSSAVTLVLPRRSLPYTFSEVATCFPQTVETVGPGVVMLHEHVLAGPGTRLTIRRGEVREIRLRSTPRAFATLVSMNGQIAITGSNEGRVWIHSWDPATQSPDITSRDGRAFLTVITGRMDMDLVEVSDMGFGTGWASGAAWKGRPGERAKGNVSRSRFERNFFGAYTFECDSMHWTDNVFANNDIYGFDPHDNSDYFIVTGNQAFGNPKHGIIFSRGCRGNVLRRNSSFSNRGHGIMFDDGKVRDDGNPRHSAPVYPVANVIEDNEVWGNEVGIMLQGAMSTVVRSNRVRDNRYGIRLDKANRNEIANNTVLRSQEFAMHLLEGSDDNRILDNRIQGAQGGIVTLDSRNNLIQGNAISGIIGKGIQVAGRAGNTLIARNHIVGRGSRAIDVGDARSAAALNAKHNATAGWMNPREPFLALLLWGAILGVPFTSILFGRGRRRFPRRRHGVGTGTTALLLLLAAAGTSRADGQSVSMTASFSAVHDDNTFKYSNSQLRDIRTGTTPYRYGITEPGDLVMGPSLALQWQQDMEGTRRRSLRLRVDGAIYSSNAAANFGEIEGTWRENFEGVRRWTLGYGYSPHRLLRKLYDSDLPGTSTDPSSYRDAFYDAQGGVAAWRHELPIATWLEWAYRFDRRTHDAAFRERDSDFHTAQAELGWEQLANGGSVHLTGSHVWRLARAEDGDPGLEGDLSYHGPELGIDGRMNLKTFTTSGLFGDVAYSVERRVHDSNRVTDTANFGRKDVVQAVEVGLGLEAAQQWLARVFYRRGWSRANIPTAALDTELGDYDQNQVGVVLEWTNVLQRR